MGVEFEVTDTGIGIDKSKMALIFEPFQQIEKTTQRSCSGLGLGLTVARRMAQLIGGTVEISSEAGVGTRVTMRFPSQQSRTTTVMTEERRYG
jgi:signal transduction histidine kinase